MLIIYIQQSRGFKYDNLFVSLSLSLILSSNKTTFSVSLTILKFVENVFKRPLYGLESSSDNGTRERISQQNYIHSLQMKRGF